VSLPAQRDPEVQRLVDEAAIRRVVYRYARAVDRCDWELLRACYHPGAIDDHGAFRGTVEELVGVLEREEWHSTAHLVVNQLVDFDDDGDAAWVETYIYAVHRSRVGGEENAGVDAIGNGRFFDRFERRAGEWRIAHRRVIFGDGRVDPVTTLGEGFLATKGFGARDRSDPSYLRTTTDQKV
jgi:ketosteroid isomerase-like protein